MVIFCQLNILIFEIEYIYNKTFVDILVSKVHELHVYDNPTTIVSKD